MKQLNFMDEIGADQDLSTPIFDYHPKVFSEAESTYYLERLIRETYWNQKSVIMYGKEVTTPRLTAWFGDGESNYSIRGARLSPYPWTKELLTIKERIEHLANISFNSVLLNYYRDGNDSVSWHSDGDGTPGKNLFVASVSFGAERQFDIRNKIDHHRKYSVTLENGSYLLMKGDFQDRWEHRIAKSKHIKKGRVNLTFRIVSV